MTKLAERINKYLKRGPEGPTSEFLENGSMTESEPRLLRPEPVIVVLKTNRYLYNVVSLGDLSWLLLEFLHDLSAKILQGHFHRQSYHIYRVPGYCKAHWHCFGCGCNLHLPYGLSLI